MKLRLAAVCLGVVGCDASGFDVSRDTGIAFDPLRGDSFSFGTQPDTGGNSSAVVTQVGSEGFWGCTEIGRTPVADPDAILDAFGASPHTLVGGRSGGWTLKIVDDATGLEVSGALELTDGGQYTWVSVVPGPGCVDHLMGAVTATVVRDVDAPFTAAGWLAVRSLDSVEQGAVAVTSTAGAALEPSWGAPVSDSGVDGARWFRIDAAVEPATLAGTAGWAACSPGTPGCADVQVLAELSAAR